jgi:hypothetical protein
MRQHKEILGDIEKKMVEQHLRNELQDLHDWQKAFTKESEICSATATWLYTFQVYASCDESLLNLIDEFGSYCKTNGIHFV